VRLAYTELEVVLVESHDYLQRVIALV
jgi:hypothetical protein